MSSINFGSNINDVIDSIDDVADDLRHEIRKRVGRVMTMLKQRARQYVASDSNYTGKLLDSIENSVQEGSSHIQFKVSTDSRIAPYAAIVEFGSGSRTNDPWRGSEFPPPMETTPPSGFPFESPDIDYNKENPYNMTGYASFAGFVGHIEEWMATKPVEPKSGDLFTSAVAIAKTIIERGNHAHPFMRPAWFDMELQVRNAARNAVRNATR